MKQTRQQFLKGINKRVSVESGTEPDRLYTLQNARLQAQGDTTDIKRIEGSQIIDDTFNEVVSMVRHNDDIIILDRNITGGGEELTSVEFTFYRYDVINETLSTIDSVDFGNTPNYTATPISEFKMVSIEDTILCSPFNKQLNFIDNTWVLNDFVSTYPIITSLSLSAGGGLEQNENYWYVVRFVYYDGHITYASSPQHIQTDASNQTVDIDIELSTDIDGNYPDIEIYRKEAGNDFFLINRIDPDNNSSDISGTVFNFSDDGLAGLKTLEDKSYIWTKEHKTHEVVRDRYIRANVEYENRKNEVEGDLNNETSNRDNGDQVSPPNSTISLYAKSKLDDGTETLLNNVGSVDTGSLFDNRIQFKQTSLDDNAKEVQYFGKITPKESTNSIEFNSLELYNSNIESLATLNETEQTLKDKPSIPHLFLGWKNLRVSHKFSYEDTLDGGADIYVGDSRILVFDEDWDSVETDDNTEVKDDYFELEELNISGGNSYLVDNITTISYGGGGSTYTFQNSDISNSFDSTITVPLNVKNGTSYDYSAVYKLKYVRGVTEGILNTASNPATISITKLPTAIYELAYLQPLKELINIGKAKLKLTGVNGKNLSSSFTNDEVINTSVDIIGLTDTSETRDNVYFVGNGVLSSGKELIPSGKNHIYLQLDQDSFYGEVDNRSVNQSEVIKDYDAGEKPILTHTFECEILGLGIDPTNPTDDNGVIDFTDYIETLIVVNYKLSYYNDSKLDFLIYLGTKDNQIDGSFVTLNVQGFNKKIKNGLSYVVLNDWNIYEEEITEDDFKQNKQLFPDQIVWSDSIIQGSNTNGNRTFNFSSFLNIGTDYGDIVNLAYVGNVLLAFCQRGVALVNVGEVLTQQAGGEVFVDSSRFLTSSYWILRNLISVKPLSVKKYEGSVFFFDGRDVWQFGGELRNLSSGAIDLDSTSAVSATLDLKNKEYRITDGSKTYAYAIELDQWFGSYSHIDRVSTEYSNRCFAGNNTEFYEHNIGNTFNGTPYTTVIESFANDASESSIVKMFRKFYIEAVNTTNAIFKYGKDYGTWISKNFSAVSKLNGLFNFGVKKTQSNSTKQFWRVESTDEGFTMRMLSMLFTPRNRR